ncbi:MAG: BatD family protein [Alphaproteobacteria bacterium]|nr:MAG: hypothetical protein B6I23_00875 [Rickettsiaceae bacterium 4572_127]
MNRSIHFFFLISTIFFIFIFQVNANQLSISVNQQKIKIGEPLILTLTYTGTDANSFGEPDLSELKKNFNLVGQKQAFSSKQINNDYKVALQVSYKFLPKSAGVFMTPSFYIGEEDFSEPYKITVLGNKKAVKKVESKTNWSYVFGSILFILGGMLFLLSGAYLLWKNIKKKKK